jgi:HEAT repeat protein
MSRNTLTFAVITALGLAATAACAAQEEQLIAVLKSDAALKAKADACRELARVGTKQAIPALAALLGDEKLSHMARYAMEPIRDPAVDEALREAMGRLSGRPLMGVIGSLGVRRDAKAVEAIAKLLSADADLAQAAARALGEIGTMEAAKALDGAVAGASPANRVAFCEGLFRCAEVLSVERNGAQALAIYDRLRSLPGAPQQVRAGALRGAILSRGKEGIPLMVEAMHSADYVLTAAAARTAIELPGPEVTAALAGELSKLPADKQLLVVNTLGYRGDASAGRAMLGLARKGPMAVRLAAVHNLTHLGYAPAVPLLAELSLSGEADLAAAARQCLGNFPGKDADAAVVGMLTHQDAKVRSVAVELIGQRKGASAIASLLKAAGDHDESVCVAAIKALRDRAGPAELPALLGMLVKARWPAEMQAAENAIAALCARQSEPAATEVVIVKAEWGHLPAGPCKDVTAKVAALVKDGALAVTASNENFGDPAYGVVKKLRVAYTVHGAGLAKTVGENEPLMFTGTSAPPAIIELICKTLDGAQGEAKLALLRALRSAGGPKALGIVTAASAANDSQVRDTALRALCDWPTADAMPLLANLIKTAQNPTIKILASRGFVRLVPQQDAPDATKFDSLKYVMTRADRNEEKVLVLSALGNIPTAAALALVTSQLDNPALREDACLAAVAIAEKLASSKGGEVTTAMRRVAKLTSNKVVAERANAVVRAASGSR